MCAPCRASSSTANTNMSRLRIFARHVPQQSVILQTDVWVCSLAAETRDLRSTHSNQHVVQLRTIRKHCCSFSVNMKMLGLHQISVVSKRLFCRQTQLDCSDFAKYLSSLGTAEILEYIRWTALDSQLGQRLIITRQDTKYLLSEYIT